MMALPLHHHGLFLSGHGTFTDDNEPGFSARAKNVWMKINIWSRKIPPKFVAIQVVILYAGV